MTNPASRTEFLTVPPSAVIEGEGCLSRQTVQPAEDNHANGADVFANAACPNTFGG